MKLMFSGEPLNVNVLKDAIYKNKIILNYYGPSETGEVTLYKFNSDSLNSDCIDSGSKIGKAFDGTKLYVLSNNLVPLSWLG